MGVGLPRGWNVQTMGRTHDLMEAGCFPGQLIKISTVTEPALLPALLLPHAGSCRRHRLGCWPDRAGGAVRNQPQSQQQSAIWRRAPGCTEAQNLEADLQALPGVAVRQLAPRPEVYGPRVRREVRRDAGADALLQRLHVCKSRGFRVSALWKAVARELVAAVPGRGRPRAPAACLATR